MKFKSFGLLISITFLTVSACVPVAFDLPGEIVFPSLSTLEKKFDLPILRLENRDAVTSFRQECSTRSMRELNPSGILSNEARQVEDFSEVVLTGQGSITISQAERTSITIHADQTLLPFLKTEVYDDQLILGIQDDVCIEYSEIGVTYEITLGDLQLLHIIGAGDVRLDELEIERLRIQLDGSAQITINEIEVDNLDTFLNGTGVIEVSGTADTQSVSLNGVGQYRATGLFTETTEIELNGTGHVEVWANSDLQLQLNGMGTVTYFGDPDISSAVSGLSGVTHLSGK
jgi:hypothetical protein